MKLSLIIPVYSEAGRLKSGIELALNYLRRQAYSWEIIVVDDGSTDVSTSEVAKWTPRMVRTIRTTRNFGKGHAIRIGVASARGDDVVFSDIDFSVPLTHLPQFLAALKTRDVAIGSRRLPASMIAKHQTLLRELLGQGFTKLSNLILGLHHTDFTCGFKGFRREAAKDLFSRQKLNRWAFDAEVLFLAQKSGYEVKEIPVTWHNDPRTKVNVFSDAITSLLSLAFIKLIHR